MKKVAKHFNDRVNELKGLFRMWKRSFKLRRLGFTKREIVLLMALEVLLGEDLDVHSMKQITGEVKELKNILSNPLASWTRQ